MKDYSTRRLVILLAPLVFTFAMGQDIFVPEVPKLIGIFHTTQGMVQLSLSLFMLSVGAGQLLVGPLSDQFGRKRILLLSISFFILGSIIAALATSINIILLARIVQGIGACGMMVGAFAIVRDLLAGEQAAEVYSYLNGAVAVSPLLAPLVGGYLDVWFGWRAPFFALALIGLAVFIVISFFITETHAPEHRIRVNLQLFKRYREILMNRTFLIYSFAAASALACFFTFFSLSPYILINLLHVPETHFGYYFAIIGIIFFLASLTAGRLVIKIGIYRQVLIGSIGFIISGLWMFLWNLHSGTTIYSFMLPTCLSAIAGAFLLGAGAGGALSPFGKTAGTASAMLGAFEFLFASLIGSTILHWPVRSDLSYAIPLIFFGIIVTLACYLNRRVIT